jgi:hypothetical protein
METMGKVMAVKVYFTMFTAIPQLGQSVGEGEEYWHATVDVPEGTVITAIEFGIDDGGYRQPVMRSAMNVHEDNTRIHTICRRDNDEIERLEW